MPLVFLRCILVLLALCLAPNGSQAEPVSPPAYTVAVMPAVPAVFIKQYWQPILNQLSQQSGLHFHLRLFSNMADFERSLSRNEVDIAVVSPVQILAHRSHLQPLLRNERALTGLVMVPLSSPVKALPDLAGRTVATQSSAGFPADAMVRSALLAAHIAPRFKLTSTEVNAAQSVALRRADAAILSNYSASLLPPSVAKQLRVMYQSAELPGPTIATHPRLGAESTQKIKAAFLQLRATHAALLKPVLIENLVEADFDKDYAVLAQALPELPTQSAHQPTEKVRAARKTAPTP